MSPEEDRLKDIRRILVALDASPASLAALDLAAELAGRYRAELLGIYVEDINLLHSAEIPFAKEIGFYSATSRRIDRPHIERELRAHAHRVERLLASIAEKANLRWSFRRSRGVIHGELLEAAEETDLIILGKTGWSGRDQIGSTAREIAIQAPIQSLILLHKVRKGTPIMVAYDGSPTSQKTLSAARLISTEGSTLIVVILADTEQQAEKLQAEVKASIEESDQQVEFHWLADINGDRIHHLALISGCDLVVLPSESESFDPETLVTMLNKADCAVLLVR
jgi:nucleotide-binding universal stress UspA family protein